MFNHLVLSISDRGSLNCPHLASARKLGWNDLPHRRWGQDEELTSVAFWSLPEGEPHTNIQSGRRVTQESRGAPTAGPGDHDDALVSVTLHSDSPDADLLTENRESVGDFSVYYSDEAAQDERLVSRSLDFIKAFPGVERVVQEDREVIYGWGTLVDPESLKEALVLWWRKER